MWIKFTDANEGLHEIETSSIIDCYFDGKNNNWVIVLTNRNGIVVRPEIHDKIMETLGGITKDLTTVTNNGNKTEETVK